MKRTFSIRTLSTSDVERVRSAGHDAFGNAIVGFVDPDGGSPCRHCLERTQPGDRVLLFAHRPFAHASAYAEIGPIFVHERRCEPFVRTRPWPDAYRNNVILRAYDREQVIAGSAVVVDATPLARANALFDDERVAFVDVRSLTNGCWFFRLERAAQSENPA